MARTTRTAHTVARVAHTRGSPGSPGSLADLADPNLYAEKRPAQMKTDDAHFYLAVKKAKSGCRNLASKKLLSVYKS